MRSGPAGARRAPERGALGGARSQSGDAPCVRRDAPDTSLFNRAAEDKLEQRLLASPEQLGYDTSLWSSGARGSSDRAGIWRAHFPLVGPRVEAAAGIAGHGAAPRSDPWAGRWSATSDPSATGRRRSGRTLKAQKERRTVVLSTKRIEPAAAPPPHVVAARPHPGCCNITLTGGRFRSSQASRCGISTSGCIPGDPRAASGGVSQTLAAAFPESCSWCGTGCPRIATCAVQGVRGLAEGPHPHQYLPLTLGI